MKRIIVTPAGRERYLEILLQNLKNLRDEFDQWDIWVNTTVQSDINYIDRIAQENDFIQVKKLRVPHQGNESICSFFVDYVNPSEIYLRLDDDVVYVQKGSIKKLFDEREVDDYHFLLFGNILNNAVITHIQQRAGNISCKNGKVGYRCLDSLGWNSPSFALSLHNEVLEKIESNQTDQLKIQNWILYNYERVSINVISWRGDDFAKFKRYCWC